STPYLALYLDIATVGFDDFFRNRQAEAGALCGRLSLVIGLVKLVEDVGKLFRGDAGASISDRNDYVAVCRLHCEGHCAATRGKLECVREEVAQHLVDAVLIPKDSCR